MPRPKSTTRARAALQSSAILAGAGLATALGWSALVETEPVAAQESPVLVCQATGDGTYVLIRVRPERLEEYRRNPNNIVPAPPAGCPASVGAGQEPAPTTTAPSTPPPPTDTMPEAPPLTTPEETTPRETAPRPKPRPRPKAPTQTTATTTSPSLTPPAEDGTVSPSTAGNGSNVQRASLRRSRAYTGSLPSNLKRLPNTGDETALMLFLGGDLLLLGAGLRLRSRRSAL